MKTKILIAALAIVLLTACGSNPNRSSGTNLSQTLGNMGNALSGGGNYNNYNSQYQIQQRQRDRIQRQMADDMQQMQQRQQQQQNNSYFPNPYFK